MDTVRGRLVTTSFAQQMLARVDGVTDPDAAFVRDLDRWWDRADAHLGPASSVRTVTDSAAVALLRLLGFDVERRIDAADAVFLEAGIDGRRGPTMIVTGWGHPLPELWRRTILHAVAADARWALLFNGTALRIVDAHRTWTREHLEFNLAAVPGDRDACRLLWCTATASAMSGTPPLLDRLVDLSSRHGLDVCRALGTGVVEALTTLVNALRIRRRADTAVVFEHSLTVLYRVLFLLFAEARGLVPLWHPVYRDRYSIDTIVTTLLTGRRYRGLWHAVLAISRLAHGGCAAGALRVTAFNGRLFSPTQAASFDRAPIDDATLAGTILALSTTIRHGPGVRTRIAYADLDVEQLGAVYEQVLEYEPSDADAAAPLVRTRDARKASGTFYTPRTVTAHLVRRTLGPLVRGRSASGILSLRVLDPAMGSGAFLVAACRYLATAVEEARVREGTWHAGDVTPADRVALRREIASRCLYGVDLNPMAVQLARLSLWLATLAADKPLSFLDHRLVAGDSLVGASMADVERQPSKQTGRTRAAPLPLFERHGLDAGLESAARARDAIALQPDDSADVVREKERALAALGRDESAVTRWSSVLDLWCAGWFWNRADRPDRATFRDLADRLLHDRSSLAASVSAPLLEHASAVAAERRFLHWPLVFPEALGSGADRDRGFDAVIGNPPWDMLRGDSGAVDLRAARQRDARSTTDFVREAGIYRIEGHAHVNRYQLFVERGLQLLRTGGRLGFVLPSGVLVDAGAAALRRHLFDRAEIDAITGLDNRGGIFPIHRSVRFVLLTCTAGRPTSTFTCRFGVARAQDLDADHPGAAPLVLTRRFVERVSGPDDLGVPDITTATDVRLIEQIAGDVPWLSRADGWHVTFGRELNATDDRGAFVPATGGAWSRPVVEGKQLEPFRVDVDRSALELRPGDARARRVPRRARLAYRDVASATNRLTLIAAIVPARAVTTHTLFCLRTTLPLDQQQVLCALLNSFVANYLVRFRVNTHVTVALVSRLPVPVVRAGDIEFDRLASLARTLSQVRERADERPEYAELQAVAAHLYGLGADDFAHVLSTFPLIPDIVKTACLTAFSSAH